MLKNILLITCMFLGIWQLSAQTYNMSNTTVSTCSGTFYDNGGTGNYPANTNLTMTFCNPTAGQPIYITFTSFNTESGFDYLYAYNGANTAAPSLGTFTGTASPGTLVGASGCITINFTSDFIVNAAGWVATISCTPPPCSINATPLCNATSTPFPGSTTSVGSVGCLLNIYSPTYYVIQPTTTGNLTYTISSSCDVDFALWGPFSTIPCNMPTTATIDCSFLTASTEYADIANAVPGQYYLLLVSNYCNVATTVNLTPSGSAAAGLACGCGLTASATPGTIACNGGTTSIPVTATGATTYNYAISPNVGTLSGSTFNNIPAGNYTITVTNAANLTCSTTVAVNIAQPTTLTANASSGFVLCNGGTTNVTVNASGGTPGYQYSLNGGAYQASNIFNVAAGTYNITVQDANNCTTNTSITVSQPTTAVSINASATNILCNGGTSTISITGNGGTPGYQYSINGGTLQAGNTFTVGAGTYTCLVSDVNGCTATSSVTISEPTSVIAAASMLTPIACNGGTGSLQGSASGGTAGYTYTWNTIPPQYTVTATNVSAGTYTLTVVDANSCTGTATVTLSEPTSLVSSIGQTPVSCYGNSDGTATVSVSGGTPNYTYSWDTSPSQNTASATGLIAGVYTCYISDANGCSIVNSITVTEPNTLLASAAASSILCNGGNGTITITASGGNGGYQYSIDGGATYQAGNIFSVVAGTYNISVIDANNCTGTDTITLTEPSMMVLSNYVETCAINGTTYVVSFDVTGGTGAYTVSGTTGSFSGSTFTSNAIPTGTSVNITVSDANGCALPVVATVGNCTPAVPCNTTTGCYLSNLIVDGDFENFNPATPFGNFSSSYDYYDCDLGNSVCVNGTTGQNILCQYDFAVETGTPACNNTWSANIADHTTGTGNMMLVDFPVGLSAEIWGVDVTLLPNTTYCFGAHFMNLVPSGTGYVNPVFRFEANGSILGNSASIPEDEQWHYEGIQFNSGAGGLVHLSMFNQNFGALGYDMAIDDIMIREVTNGTVPITVADAVNICDNQGVITFDVLGNDTGTGINSLQLLSYPAFSVGNATADFATGSVTFVPDTSFAGTTSFTYQITTNLGCSAVGTINLTEVVSPTANISGTTTFCQNVISNLDAGAGFATYNWTTPVGAANTQTVLASASGTYQLIVTNANNCADTTSTLVTINPLPTPNITGTATAICAGSFTTLDAGAGYAAYSWFQLPLNTLGNAQTQLVNSPATYGVGVIDANGCQNIDTINIGLNANPVVTITPSGAITFCPGASVDLDAGAGWNSYSWSSIPLGANGNGQVFTANSTADFIATVTNGFGCIGADTITVTVIDNVPPVITNCPANITQNNDATVCGAIVNWTPLSVTDNCTFNIVQTSGVANGGLFPIGTTTVSYEVTDAGGNMVTCSFTVTINDTENPVITNCPANIVVSNDANICGANVSWANLTFTDNCPNGIISQTAGVANGGLFPVGITNVSYTATDASGNTATCSFTVTVNDTENPVIANCPANMNLNAAANQCGAVANWTNPTVSDNCAGASISQTAGLANGALFPLGTTTVTYTATDAAGNSVVCSFTVTVTDNTAPTIVGCPANINLTAATGACSAVANWTTPSVTDNCAGATLIQTAGNSNGTLFALGTTTVTYLATDANGNTATCSFTVTVTDNVAPVIAGCPNNIVLTNGAGLCGAIATWTNPTATDNCTLASFAQTQGLANGALFPLGTTTIQYTAVDAGGNSSICSFTVTVSDTEAPVIAGCPSNIVQQATQGCSTPVTWNMPSANDNCSGVTLTSNFNSGDLFAVGTTTVTYTATDAVGNTSTCSFNVTVTPPPAITLSANVVSQITCNGFADGSAMVNATGGTGLYNYSWLTIPPQISATATGLAAGTYTVFVIDANAPACVDTQFTTVTLTQPNLIVVTATVINNSTCEQANASAIVSATGGSGNYVYEWNSTPPQNTALATGLLAGTYTAMVTDVVNGACNASASVNITTTPVPVAIITPSGTTTICEGTTTTFTATGGNSYMWIFNGNLTSSGSTFIAQQAGDYQVIAYSNVNQVGCADTSEVNILVVNPAPSADILPTNTNACEGETVTLTAAGEGNIDWLLNGVSLQNSNNPISVSTSGNYQVVRSNNCGSATSTSVLVQIHPNPVADFIYEPQAPHVGDLVVFADKSISGAVWAWDFGNNVGNSILQNPTYIYVDSGYYTVSMYIEDIFGCKDSVVQTLFVSGQPTDFIPNIFSPNNDGEYDDFIVEYGNMKLDHFQVFDRWGNRVFITQNPAQTWNGNNENGAPCSAGVYFYAVQMKDAQGKEIVKKGNVTLIR